MPTRSKPALLVYWSDTHCDSTVGLCPGGGVPLDGGGNYTPSKYQRWLWRSWLDFAEHVKTLARGRLVYGVAGGDATEGDHHDGTQLVSRDLVHQRETAIEALEPVTNLCDRLFIVRGTPAHDGRSGQDAEAIAKELGAECTDTGAYSAWEWKIDLAGVPVHCSHAGSGTRLPWARNGPAVRMAAAIVAAARRGDRIPQLVLRSHVHLYHDSHDAVPMCRVIISPAWQLCTDFGHKLPTADYRADIGGVIVLASGGAIEDIKVVRYEIDQAAYWRETGTPTRRPRTIHGR